MSVERDRAQSDRREQAVTREELIAEAAKVWRRTLTGTHTTVMDTAGLSAVIDAITPIIRADERADLRAKVKTLLDDMHSDWSNPRYQAVLDLIDGTGL